MTNIPTRLRNNSIVLACAVVGAAVLGATSIITPNGVLLLLIVAVLASARILYIWSKHR